MRNSINSGITLLLVVIGFLVFTMLNNQLFSGIRLDLTESNLYTLSEGSLDIVSTIDEPINLYFFFSDSASRELTGLRAYAKQVQDLLEEYELKADGGINMTIIDPEPFSEEEDRANTFGLQSVPVSSTGSELYFGLAGTNALDDQLVIPFFQPDKEAFLEYEISKMIQTLQTPEKPVVGLLSSIKVQGDVNMQTFQTTPAWIMIDQIEQLFEVETVESSITSVPENIDLLLVIHPKALAEETLYALDQFAMGGGRLLIFVDPMAERDRAASANPMMQRAPPEPSDLNRLTTAWGVTLRPGIVLLDSQNALSVSGGPSGQPVRHLAILGMGQDNFSADDITISALENINMASVGILDISDDLETKITPLIQSSTFAKASEAMQLQFLTNPADLQKGFEPTGEVYPVAVRIEGKANSAFSGSLDSEEKPSAALGNEPSAALGNEPSAALGNEPSAHIAATDDINVILVADTDLLSDHMWVQVQNFFGQRIASPWANNGDFVTNTVDNLVGSAALISVRSRGRFSRPFNVVQDLRREAETRYLESANDLQAQLSETEQQLSALETSRSEQGLLSLSPEQETALVEFQQEKLRIRKQLRDVRHQLDKDIEGLGSMLKFLNIALIPILLTLMLLMLSYAKTVKRSSNEP
ncbi:MAG TPA: Gldg family protein [Pseudomonadales bacterium]|nr:Gldg family protein [Pseudomonadales bacterium]